MIKRDIHDLPIEGLEGLADRELLYTIHFEQCIYDSNHGLTYNGMAVLLNDIPQYDVVHNGGCIVASPGDIGVVVYGKRALAYRNIFLQTLRQYLENAGLNAIIDENDILIQEDGKTYKICGTALYDLPNNRRRMMAHISIGEPDLQQIRNIVIKPQGDKIPSGLNKGNISSADIEKVLEQIQEAIYETNI